MFKNVFRRWLSWIRPMPVEDLQGHFGPLQVRWERGRKVLNTANANQSFGTLHLLWRKVFEHLELVGSPPGNVLLLGVGAGSVVHILRKELNLHMPITAVELDPVMVDVAERHFALAGQKGVHIVLGDATIQVHAITQRFDLILVDLFDDLDLARGVDRSGFAHALRDRCTDGGTVCFNTVPYDPASEACSQRVFASLNKVFNSVEEFSTEEMNRVFIAR